MSNKEKVSVILADYDQSRLMEIYNKLQTAHPNIRIVSICQNAEDTIEKASTMEEVDAILTDYNLLDKTAGDIAEELEEDSPETAVYAISDALSADFVFKVKRKGVAEVFARQNLSVTEVANRIVEDTEKRRAEWKQLSEEHGAIDKGSKAKTKVVEKFVTKTLKQEVILTYNIKGGVGKSTVASNLATAIKTSPYLSGKRIALVDFDCGGANISTIYNIPDEDTISKNLYAWEHIDVNQVTLDEIDSLMIPGPHNIMISPAPLNFVNAEKISYEIAKNILQSLKKYFDVIVIDGAPNLNPVIDCAIEEATKVLLIANAEGQSVKQLARITALLEDINENSENNMMHLLNKMFLVINNAQKPSEWDLSANDIARTVGRPLLKEIPNSDVVKRALHGDSKKLPIEIDPTDPFTIAIKELANDLVGAYPEGVKEKASGKKKEKKKKKRFSLFGGD